MLMGEKIKELRKAKGLSQYALAEKIGCAINLVNWWENGKFYPSLFNAICLADFFNVSLDELCCRNFKGEK
jgi:transcriptional regulator with XRE-family HTH domain